MTVSQEKKLPSVGELAGLAVLLVAVISAWLYATGWTYAYLCILKTLSA
jgi:hypothetical protein